MKVARASPLHFRRGHRHRGEVLGSACTTVVLERNRSQKVASEQRERRSCVCGCGQHCSSVHFRAQEEVALMAGVSLVRSVLCPPQNQVVVAAGRSSWGARLSGALHVYSLGSD